MEILIFVILVATAMIMEFIDAGLGMGYGTVLTPLLLSFDFSPVVVVPAVLFSQAMGGTIASIFHHRFCNVNFKPKTTNLQKIKNGLKKYGMVDSFKRGIPKDLKVVFAITFLGVIATVIGAFTAINIPKWLLKGYIGVIVLVIGFLLMSRKKFRFSWKKITCVGILASFNKGISGGGFGPVTTGGQVVAGNNYKNSIGCTTLAEGPICIAGFLTYTFLNGLTNYDLITALSIGAFLGAPLGAALTSRLNGNRIRIVLSIIIILLGGWTIIKLLM